MIPSFLESHDLAGASCMQALALEVEAEEQGQLNYIIGDAFCTYGSRRVGVVGVEHDSDVRVFWTHVHDAGGGGDVANLLISGR